MTTVIWYTTLELDRVAFNSIRAALKRDPRTAHAGDIAFEVRRPTVCSPEGEVEILNNNLRRMLDPSDVATIIELAIN